MPMVDRRTFILTTLAAMLPGSRAMGAQRFYAPAESAPHARTWMCWPSTPSIYGDDEAYFEDVQRTLGRIAAAIAENEPVMMLSRASLHSVAARYCGPKVQLIDIATDDMWSRDCAPVFVRNAAGEKAVVDFNFNGWGNRQEHRFDSRVSKAVATYLDYPYTRAKIVGEGGGIEYDGEGTLILTESSWINDNRNPGLGRDEIEAELMDVLGVEKVIWLPGVRDLDITDGHIDGMMRIIRPGLLMMGSYPGDTSEWGRADAEARKILEQSTDARGRKFEIVDIPSATKPRSTHEDLFTGYANFYVGNGAIYTPEFGDEQADRRSVEILGKLFPDRRIVVLEADRIYESGGGIHCVTQQEPA